LLSDSRLDLQVELACCLSDWISAGCNTDGHLVLAWANLGALVEGALMLILCVYYNDFRQSAEGTIDNASPDRLTLEQLRVYCSKHVWLSSESRRWDPWILRVMQRRNAIHAFRRRELGNVEELHRCVHEYLELMRLIDGRLPYPDGY
jgi:hypothetical protein